MKTLVTGLGRVVESTTAAYWWALVALYAAAVVVGFVYAWPVGLALLVPAVLAYVIWSQT